MDARSSHPLSSLLLFLQRHLLVLLLGCYIAGALAPRAGFALREASAGSLRVLGNELGLTVPMLMLSFLLFSAGVGTRMDGLKLLLRRPRMLVVGLLVNCSLPVVYAACVAGALQAWPEPEETQSLLMGLALLGAMPIAAASTAWAQNCDGNLALSLGLVLFSTLLSPVSTPLVLHAIGTLTSGDYAEDLAMLAQPSTQLFLAAAVAIPSMLGITVKSTLNRVPTEHVLPWLKLANLLVLLILNYSNAALVLPGIVHAPDLDYLALAVAVACVLCGAAFWLGGIIARLLRGSKADEASLMFGLGMNNNGTALVLASRQRDARRIYATSASRIIVELVAALDSVAAQAHHAARLFPIVPAQCRAARAVRPCVDRGVNLGALRLRQGSQRVYQDLEVRSQVLGGRGRVLGWRVRGSDHAHMLP